MNYGIVTKQLNNGYNKNYESKIGISQMRNRYFK